MNIQTAARTLLLCITTTSICIGSYGPSSPTSSECSYRSRSSTGSSSSFRSSATLRSAGGIPCGPSDYFCTSPSSSSYGTYDGQQLRMSEIANFLAKGVSGKLHSPVKTMGSITEKISPSLFDEKIRELYAILRSGVSLSSKARQKLTGIQNRIADEAAKSHTSHSQHLIEKYYLAPLALVLAE